MKISGNRKSLFFHQFVFFMVAVLLLNMPVSSVYAAENNPEGNTISFPNINNQDDNYMETNNGTISILFATGTVKTNYGTIETSNGTVTENRGTIEKLLSGNVGTNYGTIDEINGTGTLGENDALGTVTLNNGNTITRNDGKIVNNYGTVLSNYHEIVNNYGNVTMYIGSSVTNNDRQGVLTFKGNGTVESNTGTIGIEGANVTVNNNTGTIEIEGANVTVNNNTGTIKLLDNATLICTNNYGSIVKENDIATYKCTCTNNYGTIGFSNNSDGSWSYVSQYYKIVFAGDNSKAELTLYEASNAGNRYTKKGSAVEFILPDEYVCNSGDNKGNCGIEGKSKWLVLTENVDEERKEFNIVCHLCSADSYSYDADKHWQSCSKCGRQLSESAHSFGDYVSNNDATCTKDGTKTHSCTVCGYKETVADVDSHLKSDKHNPVKDPEVAATENRTGLTEGSHCADCHKVLVAQSVIPKLPHECVSYSDYSYNADIHWRNCLVCGSRKYEGAHVFGSFTQNNDATCTKDGTKTHSCTVCGYKETVADVDSHLKSDKHNPVKDPGVAATENRTGLTEGSHCADCHKVLVAQSVIPKLPHECVSYSDYSYNADIHWRNCTVCGSRKYEGAHVFGSFTPNNDATCTKDGTKTHSCTVCGYKETVADVDSHLKSDKHNPVKDPGVAATENRTGLTEGSHCADCHKVLVAQSVIPKLPHECVSYSDYSYNADIHWRNCTVCGSRNHEGAHVFGSFTPNNDATCTKDGTKTHSCTVCGYKETVADVDSHLKSDKHNPVKDPEVAATENRTGLTEGSHCADCHKVLVAQSIIPKLSHKCVSYSDYSYNADIHWRNCLVCGSRNHEGAHVFGSFTPNNDATCTKDGTKTHSCTVCGYKETVADVDSHLKSDKHNPVKDPEVAATENRAGLTEGSHCADCQKVLVAQEIIPEKTHICVSDSGYLYDANGHWQSCSICGNRINDETHKFDEFVTGDDATCTIDGTKTHSCTVCTYKETVADVDSHLTSDKHNIVVDPRVEATEIRTGLTEGSHCADCGRVFAAQEIIPMKESSGTVVLDSRDSEPKDTEDTPISDDTKTDDAVPDDAVPDDAVSDDAVSDDAVSDDEVSDDAVSDDEVPDDEVPDDAVPDDVVSDDAVSDDIVASDNTPAPNDKSDVFSETGDDASNTDEAANGKESEKKTTNVVPIVAVSSSVVVIGSLVTVWGLKRRKRFK